MEIRTSDYRSVREHIFRKRWQGYEFVAFPNDRSPIRKQDLSFFTNDHDAREFCDKMSANFNRYACIPTGPIFRVMSEAMTNNSLLMERDGLIDITLMIAERRLRLEEEQLKIEQNSKNMIDKVKYTGFGETLEGPLNAAMQKGDAAFTLDYEAKFRKDEVTAKLYFNKSKSEDKYFFNKYEVTLKQPGKEPVTQAFYLGYDNNITFKEAYNLVAGRSVYKELAKVINTGTPERPRYEPKGEKYNSWLAIDFTEKDKNGNYKLKQYHDRYGFNLKEVLEKYPLMYFDNESQERLIASLQKGNLQAVKMNIGGEEELRYIEAAPRFRSINQYDKDFNPIRPKEKKVEKDKSMSEAQKVGESATTGKNTQKKDNVKQENTPSEGGRRVRRTSKRRGQSV